MIQHQGIEKMMIAEWDKRYEVNKSGDVWKEGQPKRSGPLSYVRSKVTGLKVGPGWRKLVRACDGDGWVAMTAFGVFHKMLEIAADVPRDLRDGTLYNGDQEAASVEDLCELIGCGKPVDNPWMMRVLKILAKCGWIKLLGPEKQQIQKFQGDSRSTQHNKRRTEVSSTSNNSVSETSREEELKRKKFLVQFVLDLEEIVGPLQPTQVRGLDACIRWFAEEERDGHFSSREYSRIKAMARRCKSAKVPIAAFFHNMGEAYGYVSPTKQKGKTYGKGSKEKGRGGKAGRVTGRGSEK